MLCLSNYRLIYNNSTCYNYTGIIVSTVRDWFKLCASVPNKWHLAFANTGCLEAQRVEFVSLLVTSSILPKLLPNPTVLVTAILSLGFLYSLVPNFVTSWSILIEGILIRSGWQSLRTQRNDRQMGIIPMMTSSNGNIFRVTGYLCGEFTGSRWNPRTKASDAELWFFLRPNKRLSKPWQSRGWWFETPSCALWRHCNVPMPTGHKGNPPDTGRNDNIIITLKRRWNAALN